MDGEQKLFRNLYIGTSLLSSAVLCVMWFLTRQSKQKEPKVQRLFELLMILMFTWDVVDVTVELFFRDAQFLYARPLTVALMAVYYVLFPAVFFCWAVYSRYACGKPPKRWFLMALPGIFCLVLALFTPWTGWLYTIDANNHYTLNAFAYIEIVAPAVYVPMIIWCHAQVLKQNGASWKGPASSNLALFLLPVVVGWLVDVLLQLPVITLCLMIAEIELAILAEQRRWQAEIRPAEELKQLKAELHENHSALLLGQIQPHFLFNSLVAIEHLCEVDPLSAQEAIREFSAYLRSNLDSLTSSKPIPFEKEMEHVRNYLALEMKRLFGRLNVQYELNATNFTLPALTVQPIVENAVRYAIAQSGRSGTITISSFETDTAFVVTVHDNGPGFDPSALPEPSGRAHVGLENVRARLANMSDGILSVDSTPPNGTTVRIEISKVSTVLIDRSSNLVIM